MLRRRPFSVTLLLWAVLILLAWGAVRFFASLRAWNELIKYQSSLSPVYLSITGAGWAVVGCVLIWGMFAGRPWIHRVIFAFIALWLLEYWIERSMFEASRPNLEFAAVSSILILGIALVCTLHKSTRDFFTRSEEYEQQHKNPDSE